MIKLTKERTFRRTEGVHFADIGVPGSNGIDLVEHTGPSISPPDRNGEPTWYIHAEQVDNNRVIHGERLFELFNPRWTDKHWFVFLTEESGALEIPAGCYHRSYSGTAGSLLLNHAIRSEAYDESMEFHPRVLPIVKQFPTHYYGITAEQVEQFIANGMIS